MSVDDTALDDSAAPVAKLNSQQEKFLSEVSLSIRTTVSNLSLPEVSALSVLDAAAIDSLKDLYYALNSEDPLNVMPVRRHVLESKLPMDCLVPIAVAADCDPAAPRNRKRWSLPTYQTLRLFSVLTLPISESSELSSPSRLDYLLLDLRFQLASHRKVLSTFVSLLQYYVDRKSEKRAALLPAEESKVEDARIDNILRFFGNLLSPPRMNVGETIMKRDRAIHLALVGSLVEVDFFSTLTVLFSSGEDSNAHYTDFVFLVGEIYGLAYRHTSPLQMIRAMRFIKDDPLIKVEVKDEPNANEEQSVTRNIFADDSDNDDIEADKVSHQVSKKQSSVCPAVSRSQSSGLRDALLRERATIGGSRAATVSARWTSRHSGGFTRAVRRPGETLRVKSVRNPNGVAGKGATNLVISAKRAIQSTKVFNSKHDLQEKVQVNSDILCLQSTKKRAAKDLGMKQMLPMVRLDLQDDGLKGLVKLTSEMIDVSFEYFIRELRGRIIETRERAQADESDVLKKAEQAYLTIVGSVVGFHREKCGKVYQHKSKQDGNEEGNANTDKATLMSQLSRNNMKKILSTDFKIIKTEWKQIEAAIELESFQIVFGILADACSNLREGSKEENKISLIELSTFSVLEMIKMLQGMAAIVAKEIEEAEEGKQGDLTPRELALNTLEQLFEREAFLNAPADLAKLFTTKMFSFRHLSNIVEMAHAFTAILLDEEELSRIAVAKTRRKIRKQKKENDETKEDKDEDYKPPENMGKDKERGENMTEKETGKSLEEKEVAEQEDNEKENPEKENVEKDNNADKETPNSSDATTIPQPSLEDKAVEGDEATSKQPGEQTSGDQAEQTDKDKTVEDSEDKGKEQKEGTSNDGKVPEENPETDEPQQVLSAVEMMLQADEADMAKGATPKKVSHSQPLVVTKKPISQVEQMLQTDEKVATSGAPEPEYVRRLDGGIVDRTKLPEIEAAAAANIIMEENEDYFDEEMREVESIGIVRRFASTKAIETLLIPVRAALCKAGELSGKVCTTPEGSESIMAPSIVAKSASVAWAIWKVSELRERGALCAQFFSFGILHLLGIALKAESDGLVHKLSTLDHVAILGKEVTQIFFKWLTANPGLMYDMFVIMDKTYTVSFARKVNQEGVEPEKERRRLKTSGVISGGGKKKKAAAKEKKIISSDDDYGDFDLFGNDSDESDKDVIEKTLTAGDKALPGKHIDNNAPGSELRRKKRTTPRRTVAKQRAAKRAVGRKRKTTMSEDEDVDDLDALRFGNGGKFSSSEDDDADDGVVKAKKALVSTAEKNVNGGNSNGSGNKADAVANADNDPVMPDIGDNQDQPPPPAKHRAPKKKTATAKNGSAKKDKNNSAGRKRKRRVVIEGDDEYGDGDKEEDEDVSLDLLRRRGGEFSSSEDDDAPLDDVNIAAKLSRKVTADSEKDEGDAMETMGESNGSNKSNETVSKGSA